jgi:hypothetical protein
LLLGNQELKGFGVVFDYCVVKRGEELLARGVEVEGGFVLLFR